MKVRLTNAGDNSEIGVLEFTEVPMIGDTVIVKGSRFVVDDRIWYPHEYPTLRLHEAVAVIPEKEVAK